MKKSKLQILVLLALFWGNLPLSADPIELAKWTFETGYDVNENVYTPNDSPWAEVGAQWFNAGAPISLPMNLLAHCLIIPSRVKQAAIGNFALDGTIMFFAW